MTPSFFSTEVSDPELEHDGIRYVTVKSPALKRRADVSLWAPPAQSYTGLLILLHGVYGSHWVWTHKGGVHVAAQSMYSAECIGPMVIAMPSDGLIGDGSAYLCWPDADVERWIVDEVPAIAATIFPQLTRNYPLAIAGLSMGGFGALRIGSRHPDRFCAISCHSPITKLEELWLFTEEMSSMKLAGLVTAESDPLYWLKVNKSLLPAIRFDCGLDDPLLCGNRRFRDALEFEGIRHEFHEYAGGHTWTYWNQYVRDTLLFVDRQFSMVK